MCGYRIVMSRVIVTKPPGSVKARDLSNNRRFHTLHYNEHIFTIQKNGTSVVAFRSKVDAHHFGKLLESHFELSRSWPAINFEDSILFRKPKEQTLKYLYMHTWKESELRDFCIDNYMNMLDIFRIEDDYRLIGRSVTWEAPMDFYIENLNRKLD